MKKNLLFFALLITVTLQAQIIDNDGNRTQTYPKVTQANPAIQALVNQVSIPNLEAKIRWMQNLGCRGSADPQALQTQNWLVDQFETMGLDVSIHHFPCNSGIFWYGQCAQIKQCVSDTFAAGNVVAVQRGTEFPDEYIFVTSHYDHPDGPGADDNASGTSGVLEIARILSQYQFKRSIVYVPFNAEESWMDGSLPFVMDCASKNRKILAGFNLDMIGFFPTTVGSLAMYSGSSYISDRLFEYYKTVANIYVPTIPTGRFSTGDSYGGDHMPFNMYEYPALYIGDIEYHNPCYHKACDTLGSGVNSLELAQGFTKATLAAVAELANGWLAPQHLSAVPGNGKITVSWDKAPETAKYKLFRDNQLLVETTDTLYIDTQVINGVEYQYYVKGLRQGSLEESAESNRDTVAASNPLALPYFNDFELNNNEWRLNPGWERTTINKYSGSYSFANSRNTADSENYLTIAELNWFSIPDTTTHISLSFYLKGNLQSYWRAPKAVVEITTDRKVWNTLFEVDVRHPFTTWTPCKVSLNNYIGKPFVQLRIRVECSGETPGAYYPKRIFIDDIAVSFAPAPSQAAPTNVKILSFNTQNRTATITWKAVTNYFWGYNIYRNSVKLNSLPLTAVQYIDVAVPSGDAVCYQVTAIYPGGESDFSEMACIPNRIEDLPFNSIQIAPNPSNGKFELTTGLTSRYSVAVYNGSGVKVYHQKDFSDGSIDLTQLPKGFYFVNISNNQMSVSKKIVIQ